MFRRSSRGERWRFNLQSSTFSASQFLELSLLGGFLFYWQDTLALHKREGTSSTTAKLLIGLSSSPNTNDLPCLIMRSWYLLLPPSLASYGMPTMIIIIHHLLLTLVVVIVRWYLPFDL